MGGKLQGASGDGGMRVMPKGSATATDLDQGRAPGGSCMHWQMMTTADHQLNLRPRCVDPFFVRETHVRSFFMSSWFVPTSVPNGWLPTRMTVLLTRTPLCLHVCACDTVVFFKASSLSVDIKTIEHRTVQPYAFT